jgi:hypothetical protein
MLNVNLTFTHFVHRPDPGNRHIQVYLFYAKPGQSTQYSGLDGRSFGVRAPVGARFLSSSRRSGLFWGQCETGTVSLAVKRLGREADRLSQTSAEVKNTWIYTPIPPYVFMAWCLIS